MLLLHASGSTKIAEVHRYTVTYTPSHDRILPLPTALHLRVKNTASLPFRAAYLHGPYTLYISTRRQEFQPWPSFSPGSEEREEDLRHESNRASEGGPDEGGIPVYEPHVKAGSSFHTTLPVPSELIGDAMAEYRDLIAAQPTSPTARKVFEHGGRHSLDGKRTFEHDKPRKSVTWIIEIASQVIFSTNASVGYEILLGRDEKSLGFGFPFGSNGGSNLEPTENGVLSGAVKVKMQTTKDLWNFPPMPSWDDPPVDPEKDPEDQDDAREKRKKNRAKKKQRNVHLVILTHGLHSNTGADMLFMKEAIDEEERKADLLRKKQREKDLADGKIPEEGDDDEREQIIVRGFHDNVCRTERGIKYLGKRLARYVLHLANPTIPPPSSGPSKLQKPRKPHHHPHLTPAARSDTSATNDSDPNVAPYKITSISFIGHSLGGLVQTYAIAYIHAFSPTFFHDTKPINFVALATPFLGLSNENPMYVKFALDFGLVGRTGQDLGLTWRAPSSFSSPFGPVNNPHASKNAKSGDNSAKPLLRILPTGPAHEVLKMFRNRTVYANVVNDGIVPLRTSCLLFLDWRGLGRVDRAKRENTVGGLVEWGWNQLVTNDGASSSRGRSAQQSPSSPSFSSRVTSQEDPRSDEPELTRGSTMGKAPRTGEMSDGLEDKKSPDKTSNPNPWSALMTLLRPHAGGSGNSKKEEKASKIYHRSQTSSSSPSSSPRPEAADNEGFGSIDPIQEADDLLAPPKTTILEAAGDVLNPPMPTTEFIIDPSSRPQTIFHDRIYHSDEIPPPPKKVRRSTTQMLSPNSHSKTKEVQVELKPEEKIARAYHKDLSWRKVLVRLEPDAHNNIIVRRMFANAYGWPVVQHLVETHFGLSEAALTADEDEDREENAPEVTIDGRRPASEDILGDLPQITRRGRTPTTSTDESAVWSDSAFQMSDDEDESPAEDQAEDFLGLPKGLRKEEDSTARAATTSEVSKVEAVGGKAGISSSTSARSPGWTTQRGGANLGLGLGLPGRRKSIPAEDAREMLKRCASSASSIHSSGSRQGSIHSPLPSPGVTKRAGSIASHGGAIDAEEDRAERERLLG